MHERHLAAAQQVSPELRLKDDDIRYCIVHLQDNIEVRH